MPKTIEKKKSFASAMTKNRSAWNQARKVKKKSTGGFPTPAETATELGLEDGDSVNFSARCTACKLGVDRNGNGYANLFFLGVGGSGKGVALNKGHFFSDSVIKSGSNKGDKITVESKLERFFIDLSRIVGYDTDDLSPEDLEGVSNDIRGTKPGVQLRVRFANGYLNTWINKGISESEMQESAVEDEEEEIEEEEIAVPVDDDTLETVKVVGKKEEENGEAEEEEEEEETKDLEPAVGMFAIWRAPRMRDVEDFEILKVAKRAKTVDLKRDSTGKKYPGIAWDKIELYED
tara:strand:+ start:173 stop:1045 length:873 start_codon:yes stop_codon:yes gene_type:complete